MMERQLTPKQVEELADAIDDCYADAWDEPPIVGFVPWIEDAPDDVELDKTLVLTTMPVPLQDHLRDLPAVAARAVVVSSVGRAQHVGNNKVSRVRITVVADARAECSIIRTSAGDVQRTEGVGGAVVDELRRWGSLAQA